MVKIFGEIDTCSTPIVFTPWVFKHLTNSMWGFMSIYLTFIICKYLFNRYPIKNNRKQYCIIFYFIQYILLNCSKGQEALRMNILFSLLNTYVILRMLEKYYLNPKKSLKNNKEYLDKFFTKEYKGEYTSLQPFTMDNILNYSLYIWFFTHTVYEYYTCGVSGKDSWAYSIFGTGRDMPANHRLTNSHANSVGDTIGGFLGCLFVIVTLKKYGLRWAIAASIFPFIYTGDAIIEIYRDMGWTID